MGEVIPFAPFAPDASDFSPNATGQTQNVLPAPDGWGPIPSLVGISDALPGQFRGCCAFRSDAGVWTVFAGNATGLYRIANATYTWENISRVGGYTLGDGVNWSFTKYGNIVIATAVGSTYPQYFNLASGTIFANLPNATFEAEIAWVVGDFLAFARIDGDKRKAKWSGVNNIQFWTKGQRGSSEQILPDGGDIQMGINQAQNALIIQDESIRQMVFDPASGVAFRFPVLDPNRGSIAGGSVVNIGPGDFVYLAKDGFYRGLEARPIGAGRVNKWFFGRADSDRYDLVTGVADPFRQIVWWRYSINSGASNEMLGYDWQYDRWLYSTTAPAGLCSAATAGYTLEDLSAFGNLDALQYSLDSRFWKGGIQGFAGITTGGLFGFFDGPNLEAKIYTHHHAFNWPRRAVAQRARVIADTDDATVAMAAKSTPNGTLTFGADRSRQTGMPIINTTRENGYWHQARVTIPAGTAWSSANGIDIEAEDGGDR